ncbi:putative alkaline serine protease [Nitzschia inconspicua]|uniref:Alkaline serine protease n=1 Tax=Nitzschia inconspicua TaxID=303405 RepID=A0A9K3LKM7_9STRA|nr:putative alkaline serine protease [Nitzschia inconspicua]
MVSMIPRYRASHSVAGVHRSVMIAFFIFSTLVFLSEAASEEFVLRRLRPKYDSSGSKSSKYDRRPQDYKYEKSGKSDKSYKSSKRYYIRYYRWKDKHEIVSRPPNFQPDVSPAPTSSNSTVAPSSEPQRTVAPTVAPTPADGDATAAPTKAPTPGGGGDATAAPTKAPTTAPDDDDTGAPTVSPTAAPTVTPTAAPTVTPTAAPTATPTVPV